ncbi:MAG: hypothetical protein DMF50_05550 [Acidobacteria bacterium]|nr:MAG: hypothetical protein DMF50_05550 [Acidobacteriota bacterium]
MSRRGQEADTRAGVTLGEDEEQGEGAAPVPARPAPVRPGPTLRSRFPRRLQVLAALAALAGCAALGIDAFLVEPGWIEVVRSIEFVPSLRASAPDLLLVHLSDTHIRDLGPRERRAIRIVNAAQPDLIVITGDIVHGESDPLAVEAFLGSLRARYGKFLVWGNHDHYRKTVEGWAPGAVSRAGFVLLNNANRRVDTPAGRIDIAGIDDPVTGHDNLKTAMVGVSRRDFCILLSHSPEIVRSIGNWDIDMVLAGHTHGGQVRLPWLGAIVVPFGTRPYVEGWYDAPGDVRVHVNQGLGWSYLPVRFLCRPRLDLITLRGGLPAGTRPRASIVGRS